MTDEEVSKYYDRLHGLIELYPNKFNLNNGGGRMRHASIEYYKYNALTIQMSIDLKRDCIVIEIYYDAEYLSNLNKTYYFTCEDALNKAVRMLIKSIHHYDGSTISDMAEALDV